MKIHEKYDLKGSLHKRYTDFEEPEKNPATKIVLKDLNCLSFSQMWNVENGVEKR